jgi:hypothetical protein
MAVISDCACVLPVRRAEEMPSTSHALGFIDAAGTGQRLRGHEVAGV